MSILWSEAAVQELCLSAFKEVLAVAFFKYTCESVEFKICSVMRGGGDFIGESIFINIASQPS